MNARKQLQERVLHHPGIEAAYEQLITEVVAPHLAAEPGAEALCDEADGHRVFTVYYQFPPTLRLHAALSVKFRRAHRDAEYGHQPGEINFWLPLTDATAGRASLWVEHESGNGEMHQLELAVGQFSRFYGVERQHTAPANQTEHCRVSLDFRVAPAHCYDTEWSLLGKGGMKIVHGMRQVTVPFGIANEE